jgi:PAS domain-containing protein
LKLADQILRIDPCTEDALCLAMEAEFQCGHPAGIAKRYGATGALLKAELGVEPSNQTRALRDRLLSRLTDVDSPDDDKFLDLYRDLERTLKMGAWECDLASGQLSWTQGTYELFGVPFGSAIRREEILDQYDAQSRERLEAARSRAIRNCSGFSIEVEIVTRAGTRSRLRINAAVESRHGTPVRMLGTKQLVG